MKFLIHETYFFFHLNRSCFVPFTRVGSFLCISPIHFLRHISWNLYLRIFGSTVNSIIFNTSDCNRDYYNREWLAFVYQLCSLQPCCIYFLGTIFWLILEGGFFHIDNHCIFDIISDSQFVYIILCFCLFKLFSFLSLQREEVSRFVILHQVGCS